MSRKPKLSQEDINQILKLYKEGIGSSEIGRKFKIDHSTVYYHLMQAGLLKKTPPKEKAYVILKDAPKKGRDFPLANKNLNLWKEKTRDTPLTYAEYYFKKFGKKYKVPNLISFSQKEKLRNQTGVKFF